MIIYQPDSWAYKLALKCSGSVVPKSLLVSIPAGLLAATLASMMWYGLETPEAFHSQRWDQFMGTFTSVLGFLMIFRTRIAYNRFWEAASYLQTIRGTWLNVASSCFAFCSEEISQHEEVLRFQHTLVRLVSMLYASALHEVAVMADNSFEILDTKGFDPEQFDYMQYNSKKVEILVQWVQRLLMDGHRRGVVDAPAPILSRVFQELGNGVVDLSNAKRICRYPFPFPYAQIQGILLMLHWMMSIWIGGTTMWPSRAFFFTGISTFCLWSLHYTSLEIEQPYGDDMNDLPLDVMQTSLNDSLVNLLNPLTQKLVAVNFYNGQELQCEFWKTDGDPNQRIKEREKANGKKKKAQKYDQKFEIPQSPENLEQLPPEPPPCGASMSPRPAESRKTVKNRLQNKLQRTNSLNSVLSGDDRQHTKQPVPRIIKTGTTKFTDWHAPAATSHSKFTNWHAPAATSHSNFSANDCRINYKDFVNGESGELACRAELQCTVHVKETNSQHTGLVECCKQQAP